MDEAIELLYNIYYRRNTMKLKIMASCALLALAACASNNTQVQPAPKTNYEVPAVYFDFNATELTGDAKYTLTNALNGIENAQDLKLVITGYADMYGNEDVNMKVSQKRAESVRDYLLSMSVPADKMVVKAKGKSALASTDPDKQAVERRVEVALKDPKSCPEAAAAAKAKQEAAKDSNQPWYSVLFDCICED